MPEQFEPPETTEETLVPAVIEEIPYIRQTETMDTNDQRIRDLLTLANQCIQKMKIQKRELLLWLTLFALVGIIGNFAPINFFGLFDLTGILALFTFGATGYAMWRVSASMGTLDQIVKELVSSNDARAAGTLVEYAAQHGDPEVRKVAFSALTILLPQLKSSDAAMLSRSQRRLLNQHLGWVMQMGLYDYLSEPIGAYVCAILKAWEQVGDAEALPTVERLVHWLPRNEREARVVQAAQECLPYLQANAGLVSQQQTLLRPSNAENATPDTLLRPASIGAETPSDELLRSSQADTEAK